MPIAQELRQSGTNSVTVTLTDPKVYGDAAFSSALDDLLAYDRHIDAHADRLMKATSIADIDRAREAGRLALFYQLQNSTPLQKELERVSRFHDLGVRSIQLTYNYQNYVGAGCRERHDGGLTVFGLEIVERLNADGMLVDTSHAGMRTMADAIAHSRQPITISHTCCDAINSHIRNTTDDNLRALADKGGVVGICQIRNFVTPKPRENLGFYFDHLDHAVNVAGIDHVCIGYFNRNTEEVLDIPIGPDNRIEPGGPDYGQPTHFHPRRAWGVFAIPVPADFGDQTLTWTLVANGQTMQVPMGLVPDYEVEPYREPAQGNTPPVVKFAPTGDLQQGPPLGIIAEYEATVGEPLTMTLWATDDGQVDPNRRALEGAPVRIRWSHYRGVGEVVFSEPQPETDENTGETVTTVTFSEHGEYVLRAQATDSSGARGGLQCCWTNAHVKVTVQP